MLDAKIMEKLTILSKRTDLQTVLFWEILPYKQMEHVFRGQAASGCSFNNFRSCRIRQFGIKCLITYRNK